MGKKKGKVEPVKTDKVSFKPPPATLNEHISLKSGVRMEAVVEQSRLIMRPAPLGKKEKTEDHNGKDSISNYKKKLLLKNSLGWYYYLPAFLRPTPRMKINAEDGDVPAGAIKKRNKMLLCEMAAKGNWSQCQALIDLVGLDVNEPDDEDELVLCSAAAHGHDEIVIKLFRDYRVDLLGARKSDGFTALIAAAEAGELGCVIAILECARILPVRAAYDLLKHRGGPGNKFDARSTAVKAGKSSVVEALDQEEKLILSRPVSCRHKCGNRITFGEQKEHENELCPVFTCLCVNGCGQRVRRSYMDIHQGYECVKRIRAPSPR